MIGQAMALTEESLNPQSQYFGQNPNNLLAQWQTQMTPDPIQGKYAERPEYETEFTIYGAANSKISFLLSGRYKRGVNIFPQMTAYNPEYNFQGNLEYKLNKNMKLKFSGIYGGYETCSNSLSNYNTLENSQEIGYHFHKQPILTTGLKLICPVPGISGRN